MDGWKRIYVRKVWRMQPLTQCNPTPTEAHLLSLSLHITRFRLDRTSPWCTAGIHGDQRQLSIWIRPCGAVCLCCVIGCETHGKREAPHILTQLRPSKMEWVICCLLWWCTDDWQMRSNRGHGVLWCLSIMSESGTGGRELSDAKACIGEPRNKGQMQLNRICVGMRERTGECEGYKEQGWEGDVHENMGSFSHTKRGSGSEQTGRIEWVE